MSYIDLIKKERKPSISAIKDDIKARRNPHFFWATGTQIYVGEQGSGKTISAVRHIEKIRKKHPRAIIISNIAFTHIKGIRNTDDKFLEKANYDSGFNTEKYYIEFQDVEELKKLLTHVNNATYGVVYLIDEIHTYFNALESSNIPMFVFTEISQQRKQRKLIIGTSQLFLRMAKPLREQCQNIIVCKTSFGVWTKQTAYDGMSIDQDYNGKLTGIVKKKGYFFQTPQLRQKFDTMQKVISAQEQYAELEKPLDRKLIKGRR